MITITRDHLTLLAHAHWRMSDCEYGAPEMDGKRPYGNSGVEDDLAELLPHLNERKRVEVHNELVEVIPAIIRTYTESLPVPDPTGRQVLDTRMQPNDANATTIQGYLVLLAAAVWRENEGFSGKRPFGNSGWDVELYRALGEAGYIQWEVDEDGEIENFDNEAADRLIESAISALAEAR
jgi:hypothetical protein